MCMCLSLRYVCVTNDTELLLTPLQNALDPSLSITPLAYLKKLAWAWTAYPRSMASPYRPLITTTTPNHP